MKYFANVKNCLKVNLNGVTPSFSAHTNIVFLVNEVKPILYSENVKFSCVTLL